MPFIDKLSTTQKEQQDATSQKMFSELKGLGDPLEE